MSTLLLIIPALLLVIAIGWFVGDRLAARAEAKALEVRESGESAASVMPDGASAREADGRGSRLTDAIAFVGGAYGIVLGLLLVFAVQHFVDTRQVSREEAFTAAALFSAVEPFDAEPRDQVRRDLVCYVRALATDDWAAARMTDPTGSENASAYGQLMQRGVQDLPLDTVSQENSHFYATEAVLRLVSDRQLRLLYANPEIPPIVWVVILVAAMVFTGLMAFDLYGKRTLTRVAIGATTVVLVVITTALIMLDKPFVGVGAALEPVALEGTLRQIQDAYPDPSYWQPCPRLAEEADDRGTPTPL